MIQLKSFAEFNALRKNQLLSFYPNIKQILDLMGGSQGGCSLEDASKRVTKYRDYYFMPQVWPLSPLFFCFIFAKYY